MFYYAVNSEVTIGLWESEKTADKGAYQDDCVPQTEVLRQKEKINSQQETTPVARDETQMQRII